MLRRMMAGAAAAAFAVLALPTSAQATGGESHWSLGYANMTIKAYHCTWYLKNCDWRGETIVFQKTSGKYMQWVQNEATVQVHGIGLGSLSISKNPSATIVSNVNSTAKVRWRRYVSNNVYNSGSVYAGYSSTYVSLNSCGSGDGPGGYGYVTPKCAYAGAF